jgi:23S rRNA (uracil1939-C5)-methyltransferase
MDIVLASRSPRRRELMARVTPEFRVFPVDLDETSVREPDPARFAVEAALLKAKAAAESFPSSIVIGADTIVVLGRRILGKPAGREEARAMLELLSGQRHRVITGLAFYRKDEGRVLTGYELTYVTFRPLSGAMIEEYLDREDYRDKAGAYAVQDVGDAFVRRLKGDYDNVVGFPVKKVASLLARFAAPALTLEVEDMDFPASAGVAEADGRKVVIPGAVPGDRVRVQVVGEPRGIPRAEILRLEAPSPLRAEPRCPHFGTCGGCLFQHLAYGKQLELKGRHLRRVLEKGGVAGFGAIEVEPVTPSPDLYHYRNKMEFAFAERWGELVIGLRERGDPARKSRGRTVGLSQCPIFSAATEVIIPEVIAFATRHGLPPHNPRTGRGILRHLVLREGKRTGDLLAALVTAPAEGVDFGPLAGRLAAALPRLKGFLHVTNRRVSDTVGFEETRLLLGVPAIEERLAGLAFEIGPQSFFQTNTSAAELLYGRIAPLAGLHGGSRVLGLYCGSGAIELVLARAVRQVTGVDSLPENIRNAEENAARNGIVNAAFTTGTVEDFLKSPPAETPDAVILDPPRPGLTPKARTQVLALDIPKIVYVSCNPEALARDLRGFLVRGYRIEALVPFDFFPHTPHLETLAVLAR